MRLKIDFCDFYEGFSKFDNYFYNLLSSRFELEIDSKPQILFFSNFGQKHKSYNCIKILISSENQTYSDKDYDFLVDHKFCNSIRHFRLPLYVQYDGFFELNSRRLHKLGFEDIKDRKFCNFIYSNGNVPLRIEFFKKLNLYKKVDSGGKVLNNIGYLVENKRDFISNYKFTISFENSEYEGYTTEKLFEPLYCRTLPIYWGNPKVENDFNEDSYLKLNSNDDIDSLIEKIIMIDNDDKLYLSYLNSTALPLDDESLVKKYKYDFLEWLMFIINKGNKSTLDKIRKTFSLDPIYK